MHINYNARSWQNKWNKRGTYMHANIMNIIRLLADRCSLAHCVWQNKSLLWNFTSHRNFFCVCLFFLWWGFIINNNNQSHICVTRASARCCCFFLCNASQEILLHSTQVHCYVLYVTHISAAAAYRTTEAYYCYYYYNFNAHTSCHSLVALCKCISENVINSTSVSFCQGYMHTCERVYVVVATYAYKWEWHER